jgi:hypothetical protein
LNIIGYLNRIAKYLILKLEHFLVELQPDRERFPCMPEKFKLPRHKRGFGETPKGTRHQLKRHRHGILSIWNVTVSAVEIAE